MDCMCTCHLVCRRRFLVKICDNCKNMEGRFLPTQEEIDDIEDICDIIEIFEKYNIPHEYLQTFVDYEQRLELHLFAMKNENFKLQIDHSLKAAGEENKRRRKRLQQIFEELLSIIETEEGTRKERFRFVEKSLVTEGTTEDISGECRTRIQDLNQGETVIIVAGETSAGKSSVLNLLLGEAILPVHAGSCTAVITVVKYGRHRRATVLYNDGTRKEIPFLDKEGITLMHEIAFPQNTDLRMGHNIKEIQVFLPVPFLKSGVVLADAPGIGENDFLEDYLVDYISNNQILGFMYIIMSDAAGGVQEDRLLDLLRIVIKTQSKHGTRLRFDPKAALFVCNRLDLVKEEARPLVMNHIRERLGNCWPDFQCSAAVPFSTRKAERDLAAHPDYINNQYKLLLEGLKNLGLVAMDRRIQSSYKWIEKILKRVSHYLKSRVTRLEMSERELHEKTDQSNQRLLALKHKSCDFLKQMRADLEVEINEIAVEVKKFLKQPSSKMRLTNMWGYNELPNPSLLSDTASSLAWVKEKVDDLFYIRLCELIEEWDKEAQRITSHETDLTKSIRACLNLLERDFSDIEREMRGEADDAYNSRRSVLRMSVGLPQNAIQLAHVQMHMPSKAVVRLGIPIYKRIFESAKLKRFLNRYTKNPQAYASKRATKQYNRLFSTDPATEDGIRCFIRQLMQRPFEYLKILEKKLPSLISANEESLAEDERAVLSERQFQAKYVEMITAVEELKKFLMDYGEGYIFVNDFKSDEIKIDQETASGGSVAKSFRLTDIALHDSSRRLGSISKKYPYGLWSAVYPANLHQMTDGGVTNEKAISLRVYTPSAGVEPTFREVAKLRCLAHDEMLVAEFLGIHHLDASLTPAYVYDGRLQSVKQFLKSCSKQSDIVTKILLEISKGLWYLHGKDLVHMEVSRQTITVDECGNVRLTGACLPREARIPIDQSQATADFINLPPEVLRGELYTSAADIYGFGLLFYEMVASDKRAFNELKGVPFEEYVRRTDPIPVLKFENQDATFSEGIESLIGLCVNPDPDRRPSAKEVRRRIADLQNMVLVSNEGVGSSDMLYNRSLPKRV